MTTVKITRHYNGLANVVDRLSVGVHDHDGDADVTAYTLPAGYRVMTDETLGRIVVDPAGYVAEPVLEGGVPHLYSVRGACPPVRLVEAA